MLVNAKLISIKLINKGHKMRSVIRDPLSFEWNAAFIQVVNKKFLLMHWLTRLMQNLTMVSGGETISLSFRGRDQTTYLWFRPRSSLLSSLLFSQRAVREWCRLNFSAWYDHSLSHRAHGACHQNQCVFSFLFFPLEDYSVSRDTADTHGVWELVFYPAWRMESPWYPGKETPGSNVLKW